MNHKILVKFPTRGRPDQFLKLLSTYIEYSKTKDQVYYLITCDVDDPTMNDSIIARAKSYHKNVTVERGLSTGKIHACNRDMDKAGKWDIVVLASDDMVPAKRGWDQAIRDGMKASFPDLDGVLYFKDGYTALNTMCIIGRKYFNRFGYFYHPDYLSLWCDNEFMEVAERMGKQAKFNEVLFRHEHPANSRFAKKDNLYIMNEKFYYTDKATYDKRKSINFGL